MVFPYLTELFLLSITYFAYKQVKNWWQWRSLSEWGKENGCVTAPSIPNYLPWGIERLFFMFTMIRKGGLDFLEDVLRKRIEEMKCHTYRIHGLFNSSMVLTSDPLNVQAILATKFQDFDLGALRKDNFHPMLGHGIFTAEGEDWAHYRRQLKPQFTRDQVSDLESAAHHMSVLFQALPETDDEGWIQEMDLKPLLYNFTLDISTEFLFGQSVNSQATYVESLSASTTTSTPTKSNSSTLLTTQSENAAFSEAMTFCQEYIGWRVRLRGLYWLANSKKFQDACATVRGFADKFVNVALDPNHKRPVSEKEKFVLLDELLTETRDPIELRDQVLQVLLAGRDTTSALLSWTMLLLARSPEEFSKLRKSIISHFGTITSPKAEVTFSSMKACKEITNVLYEVLRLYPLIPINGRVALRDTILPSGGGPKRDQPIAIMKGEQVGYSAYVMQRRHDIFGEDADEFVPGRWERRKLGWEMIPFSGGPRVCLGQQYALNEASFLIVRFLQTFDKIEALDMKGELKKALTITLSPRDGVKVKLHRARS